MRKNEQASSAQPLHLSHPMHFFSKPCRKIAFLEPNLTELTTDTEKQKENAGPLQVFLRSRTRGLENVISQNSPTTEIQSPFGNQPKSNLIKSSRKISVFLDSPQHQSPSALQRLHTTTATPQNSKIPQQSLIFHLKSKKAMTSRTTAADTLEEISTNAANNKLAEDNYFQTNDPANHQKVTSLFNIINSIASFPQKQQQQQQQSSGFASANRGINSINSKSSNSLLPESPLLENQKKEQYQRGWRAAIDPTQQTQQNSKKQTQDYLDQNKPFNLKSKKKTNQLISIFPTNNLIKPKLFQDSSRSFETSNYSTGLFVKTQFSQKTNLHNISGILPHGSPILKNQITNTPTLQQTAISLRLIPSSKLIMPLNTSVSQSQIKTIKNNNSQKYQNNPLSCERINPPTTAAATSTIFKDLLRKQNRNIFQTPSSRNKWNTSKTVDISRGTSIEKTKYFIDEAGQSCSQSSRNINSNRLCSSKLIHQATQSNEPSLFNEETNKQIELFLQRMKEMNLEYENPKRVSQVIYKMISNIPYLVKMLFVEEDGKQMLALKEKINLQTIQHFISQRENLRACLEQNPLNPMMLVVQRPEGKMEAAEQRLCGDLSFLEQKISLLTQKHFKEKCDQLMNALIDESQQIQSLERNIEQQISSVKNKSRNCQVENTSGLLSKHNYRGVDGYRFLKKKSFPEGTNRTHSYFKGEFGRLGEFQSIDKQTIGVTHEIDDMLERIKDLAPPPVQSKITSANAKKKQKNEKNISNYHVNHQDFENSDNGS